MIFQRKEKCFRKFGLSTPPFFSINVKAINDCSNFLHSIQQYLATLELNMCAVNPKYAIVDTWTARLLEITREEIQIKYMRYVPF